MAGAFNTPRDGWSTQGKAMSSSNSSADGNGDTYYSNHDNTCIELVEKTDTHNTYRVCFDDDVIRTTVTKAPSIVREWIADVYASFKSKPEDEDLVVGLGIEWVRLSENGQRNRINVLQLCFENQCLIFQFSRDEIAPELVGFLKDERIIFVGAGIDKDARKLIVDYGLLVARIEDLGPLADYKLGRKNLYKKGLKILVEEVLGRDLPKDSFVTLSRWDIGHWSHKGTLRLNQIEYACLDAYASYLVGIDLVRRPAPSTANKGFSYSRNDFKNTPRETNRGAKATNEGQGPKERIYQGQGAKAANQGQGAYATNQGQGARESSQSPKAPYKNGAQNSADTTSQTSKNSDNKGKKYDNENSIRVSNLPYATHDDDLRALFASYGPVERARVIIDLDSGKSRGFGFVNFVHKEDGERAIEKMNGYSHDSRILRVELAGTRNYSIRVSNLSYDANDADLLALFDGFGPVVRACVTLDEHTHQSRGFGFVNFVHKEDAERAIVEMNGYGHDHLILRVGWAGPPRSKQ